MRTLTLKVKDDYFDRLVSLLELFPKKAIKIEDDSKQHLDNIKKQMDEAMADIKAGRSNTLRVID